MSCDCGCCQVVPAPGEVVNRPWLSAVAYRIGTFAAFRKSILDALSHTPELAGLATRVSDDYTITAIELWSAVADVLTFYQERIANEAFLRTATLRDSVLRLVRLIGYELRPGAAATTELAFTLEAGATALIPAGTRVQSVPAEGEKPQKFETLAPIAADARLNRLRLFPAPAALSPVSPTSTGTSGAIIAPDTDALAAAATLAPGDRVLLYAANATEVLTVRDVKASDDVLTVRWLTPIAGSVFGGAFDAHDPTTGVYRLGRSFHLFGFDAPETVVVAAQSNPADATTTYLTQAKTDFSLAPGTQISLDGRYDRLKPGAVVLAVSTLATGTIAIPFRVDAVGEALAQRSAKSVPTVLKPLVVTVVSQSGTVTQLTLAALGPQTLANLLPGGDIRDVVIYELSGSPLRFWPYAYADTVASSDVFLPGRRSGWSTVEVGRAIEKGAYKPGTVIDVADFARGRDVLLTDAKGGTPVAATIGEASLAGSGVSLAPTATDTTTIGQIGLAPGQAISLTAIVSGPLGGTITFPDSRRELTITIGSLPTQTIALAAATIAGGAVANVAAALQDAIRAALPGAPAFARALAWVLDGAIAVAPGVAGERVGLDPSANDSSTIVALGLDAPRARFLDGLATAPITLSLGTMVSGSLRVGLGIEKPADRSITFFTWSSPVDTVAWALALYLDLRTQVTPDGRVLVFPPLPVREPRAFVRLSLDLDAPVVLDAASAVLLGNIAPASHGETVHAEILGDGDASQAFQRFTLKKKPLTYVPAATPGGVASSLTLLVNGVRWREASTLYGALPRDEVYVTRIADDATTTVLFGDGVTGARPPSGRQNIVATYRQGTGVAGRVGAAKLTTLLDRPTGVKNANNPAAADGGADPETMAKAREAAPGTVRTFGRAVSLRDFEDTALMAGEVAKASATWVWTGERRAIHLTIAAEGGATFSADGLKRIAATLATERDPNHKLLVDNYTPVAIRIDASIIVDDRYVAEQVLAAARAALLLSLSFDERRFAAPVYLSDIFAELQDVDGVVAVDVNTLDLKNSDPSFRAAHGVDPALGQPQPRLLMLPARPAGSPGKVLPAELAWVEVPSQDVTLRAVGGLSL